MFADLVVFNQLPRPLFFLKIFSLIIILFYLGFAVVVFNQVKIMNKTITEVHSSAILQTIAILNLLLAISLFVLALVIL